MYHLCTSSTALKSMCSNLLSYNILYLSIRYSFNCELNQNYMNFLSLDWFWHIVIEAVFLFLHPWWWPHEWSKHVGGYYTINLHSYTQVHFWSLLKFDVADQCTELGIHKTNQICDCDKIFSQAVHILLLRVHKISSMNLHDTLFIERTFLHLNYSEKILLGFNKSLTLLIITFSSILESTGGVGTHL